MRLFGAAGLVAIVALVAADQLSPDGAEAMLPSAGYVPLGFGALLALGVFFVPWNRLEPRIAGLWLRAMMVGGIASIGALVATTGGATSDRVWSVLLITLFAAVVCGPVEQAVLFLLTVVAYVAGSVLADNVVAGAMIYRLSILGVVAASAGTLSGMLRRAWMDAQRWGEAATTHAEHLAIVADGVRASAASDPVAVTAAVAETVRRLGWEHVAVLVADPDPDTPVIAGWRSLDDREPSATALALSTRFAAGVMRHGGVRWIEDAAQDTEFGDAAAGFGIASAIGCPFRVEGAIAGAVIAGSSSRRDASPGSSEVFELLASCAGRALELARHYAEQHERVEELRELDRLRSEFLSTVSHELRTPLTVILGLSETIDRTWDHVADDQRRALLQRVRANADGLDGVIATLLDFTRLEQGRLETRFESFDLSELLRTVTTRLGSMLDRHHVVMRVPDSVRVHGDMRLLERVVENLLTNARRHTPPGTTITVSAEPDARRVLVSVSDDGPGIAATDLPHLGERFFRAGDPRDRPSRGVGLGLALAGEVLRLHDSRLDVSSVVGEGARFSFTLPLAVEVPAALRQGTTAPQR